MVRFATCGCLLVVAGALAVVGAAPTTQVNVPPLAAKLQKTVKFTGAEADPKEPLQELLDHLSDRYEVPFDVNEAAFKADGLEDVLRTPVLEKPLPKMGNVRLDLVLRKVLARVPAGSGATFVARGNVVEITTRDSLVKEIWGENYQGPYLPLVNISFEKRPLEEALKDLAAATEYNILLDGRAAEKAQLPVSGKFDNTPLDTTVRLLADAADLRPFLVDNVIYVTAPERVRQLEGQGKPEAPTMPPAAGGVGGLGAAGGLGAVGGGGMLGGGLGALGVGGGGIQGGEPQQGPRVGQGRWFVRPGNSPAGM
jgi:hypothetical protein